MTTLAPAAYGGSQAGGRRHHVTVKKLKKALKKAGLKTTGKRSTLTRRAKKAHLKMRGGDPPTPDPDGDIEMDDGSAGSPPPPPPPPSSSAEGAGRRRSRRARKGKKSSRKH